MKTDVFIVLVCIAIFSPLTLCQFDQTECEVPEHFDFNKVQVICANRCISSSLSDLDVRFLKIPRDIEYLLLRSKNTPPKWRIPTPKQPQFRKSRYPSSWPMLVDVEMTKCNLDTRLVLNSIKNIDFVWNGMLHLNGPNDILSYLLDGFEQIVDLEINNVQPNSFFNQSVFIHLNRLVELKLINNSINKLSENIFQNQTELIDLDMTNNNLTSLPETIFNNTNKLRYLILSGNQLVTIPSKLLHNVPKLIGLTINRNQLKKIEPNAFKNLTALQNLDLSNNQLDAIHLGTLDDLIDLRFLDLSINRLESLPIGIFDNTVQIRYLLLHGNRIQSIQIDFMRFMGELETLDLSSNLLSSVNITADGLISFGTSSDSRAYGSNYTAKLIYSNVSWAELKLRGNPWECECDGAFINFIKMFSYRVDYNNITCFDDMTISEKIDDCTNGYSIGTIILISIFGLIIICVIIAMCWKLRTIMKKVDNFLEFSN